MGRPLPVAAYSISVSVSVKVKPTKAWKAFVRKASQWWPASFLSVPGAKRFVIEEKLGGLAYEDAGQDTGAVWGTVIVYLPPQRLTLALNMYPEFGGPGGSTVTVLFQETKTGTTIQLTDHGYAPQAGKAAESLKTGWTHLLKEFKTFVDDKM